MTAYEQALAELRAAPRCWLVTGVAGFIGSNLLEALLSANQTVFGLDNFTTGKRENCEQTLAAVGARGGGKFTLLEGDIRSYETCQKACRDVDYVLHQAAQVSVPGSIADPLGTHEINVTGLLNMLMAARDAGVRRVVYASSCSVYGDSPRLPLTEEQPAQPLSPYAASKLADEVYAAAFSRVYGLQAVGLRYFNVFGPRQDPRGVYAAVIPLWTSAMMRNNSVEIYGDGTTTRDFCYVANVVQANVLAATASLGETPHQVVNVAVNGRTSLNQLFELLRVKLLPDYPHLKAYLPVHRDFRRGDIRHSQADISMAKRLLGYSPTHDVELGLQETLGWYRKNPSC